MGGSNCCGACGILDMDEEHMKLRLKRPSTSDASATIGELFVDGQFICYTLEDKDRLLESGGLKVKGDTAIPRGKYDVVITHSNRFDRLMPLLLDVPQFEGVRIHAGNTTSDTEGCILVGSYKRGNDFIGSSRPAYNALFEMLESAVEQGEKITLEVV